jgi:hypothetical protein
MSAGDPPTLDDLELGDARDIGDGLKVYERSDPSPPHLTPRQLRNRVHTPDSWVRAIVDQMLSQFTEHSHGQEYENLSILLFRMDDGSLRLWLRRNTIQEDFGPHLTIKI